MKKIYKKTIKKIGILGGTFDPPHKGHLYISKVALKKFKLNRLVWILTKRNPLKKNPYLNLKKRLKLSKKLTNKNKKIFVEYLENKIKSNKTIDMLNYLKKKYPRHKLYFIMGADNLAKFHKWNKWEKIPNLAKIAIFPRQNHSFKSFNSSVSKKIRKKDWIFVNSKKIDISSSLIRKFW